MKEVIQRNAQIRRPQQTKEIPSYVANLQNVLAIFRLLSSFFSLLHKKRFLESQSEREEAEMVCGGPKLSIREEDGVVCMR